jgi:hypothetical protein
MKTKSLFFAALMIVSAVVSAAGKDEPRKTGIAIVPVKGSEIYKLVYKGDAVGRVKLNVYDQNANLILSQTFTTSGFICPLNFKGLEAGIYTIELIDGSGKRTEKITLGSPVKTVATETKEVSKQIHVSKLKNENRFLLSVMNSPTGSEKINVNIYDAENNLVFSESKKVEGNFAQVYNIKASSSSYTFVVSDKSGKIKTVRF